jgi:oxalate---CoA ligase
VNAARFPEAVSHARLRVIRCSSSAASPDLIAQVEALFRAPMLDSYGMTETSSTIVGERLPPAVRKRGSVGLPVGCEIAIIDEQGSRLEPGMVGEVIVRGPGVVRAYEGGAEVNRQSFIDGWLRTGDLGTLDQDGYLFLRGRSKELINRGGVKILPAEIDEVLNSHPAVAEAVAFAVPNEMLGEEVAAAIVPRPGCLVSADLERQLHEHCAARLSVAKVPRKIVFVGDLPKTPTGKTMRMGLAEKLGMNTPASVKDLRRLSQGAFSLEETAAPPQGIVEMLLLSMWEEVLDRRPIGMDGDFFELGGDSLQAARLLTSVEEVFGVDLGPAGLLVSPTVRGMAESLARAHVSGKTIEGSKIIAIHVSGSRPPMFIVGAQPLYRELILNLPKDQPLYALTLPDVARLPSPFRLEEVAALQVEALRQFQPEGPYALMGWCADGVLAYEMAQQLRAQGQEVSLVAMIDAFNPERRRSESLWQAWQARLRFHAANLSHLDAKSGMAYCRDRMQTMQTRLRRQQWRLLHALNLREERRNGSGTRTRDFENALALAVGKYTPAAYEGRVLIVRAGVRPAGAYADAANGWQELVEDLRIVEPAANHRDIFVSPHAGLISAAISEAMQRQQRSEAYSVEAV